MSFNSYSRKLKLRAVAAVAVATVAMIGLAGCSSGGSSSGDSATSGSVVWWGWTPQPTAAAEYIKEFNKKYPKIQVKFKQLALGGYDSALRPGLASNDGPDIFDVAPGGGTGSIVQYSNSAVNLTPAVTKTLGSSWKSKLAPIGVKGLTKDGKLYGLSVGSTFAGNLWINQDIFDKYSLKAPTTLDQWVNVCKVLQSHNQGCFVQGAADAGFNQDMLQAISDSIKPGFWSSASQGKTSWNSPTMVQTLSVWKQLFSDGIMENGALGVQQYPDANNKFLSGQYAMVMMGTWYMQYATESGATTAVTAAGVAGAKPFNMVAVPFPDLVGKGNPSQMFGDSDYGVAVNKKSKQQAAATTFATWLTTSKAGQQSVANVLNDIPALNGVQPDWSNVKLVKQSAQQPNLQNLIKETSTVKEPRLSLLTASLAQAIGDASTTVGAGKATPAQAAATLEQASKSGS